MATKITDEIFEKIKGFTHNRLSFDEELLVNELIYNRDLNTRYKSNGLCEECRQPNTHFDKYARYSYWCNPCSSNRFKQHFGNWTSGNNDIDEMIQNFQLKAKTYRGVVEWINYEQITDIEILARGSSKTMFKANWKDGYICGRVSVNDQWARWNGKDGKGCPIVLISSNTVDFLLEVSIIFP